MSEQDYKNLNVEEVLAAVQNGELAAEEALLFEKEGKARKSLIVALEELVNPEDDTKKEESKEEAPEKEEPTLVEVKFIANVKVGTNLYKAGEKLAVTVEEQEAFLKAEVIELGD